MKTTFSSLGFQAVLGASALALTMGLASSAMAQSTVSSVRGAVTTDTGTPVVGATVRVTDERTGATRSVTTDAGGNYSVRNLNVGGPYTVAATRDGLQNTIIEDLSVNLSGSTLANITMGSGTDEIIVTATRQNVTQVTTGPSAVFSTDVIQSAPSISRDIRDVIRIDPRITVSGGDDQVSCLGGSPRATAFTVDGVAVNDQFGLNSSGTPARNNFPVPFDAVQETAVEFAPFDVEYGLTDGCTVNIVTKRGSNELKGEAFFVYNSDGLTGDSLEGDDLTIDPFDDFHWGAALRGPIIKDKLFFAVTYEEIEDAGNIVGFGPADANVVNPIPGLTSAELGNIESAVNALGFPTGGSPSTVPETSRRVFTRIDWNINDNHRLELGYDYEEELQINPDLGGFEDVSFQFFNSFENEGSNIDRYSARLFSNWTDNFSTEIRFSRADISDNQGPVGGGEAQSGNPIPRIIIANNAAGDPFNPGDDGILVAGPGTFRSANGLETSQDQFKIKGDYFFGDHLFTAGYELDKQDVFNLFVTNATGTFIFDDLAALQAGTASSITANSTRTGDINEAAAVFSRNINSLYFQDTWTPNDEWTVTAGLRYEWYTSSDRPQASDIFQQRYGFSNGSQGYNGLDVLMPRLGIEYKPGETLWGETSFRGGFGIFSGNFPNVAFSNAFTNNGFGNAFSGSFRSPCTAADLNIGTNFAIPSCIQEAITASTSAGSGRTDAIDPDLKLASIARGSLGFTHYTDFGGVANGFFDDWRLDGDFIYSENRDSYDFVDLTLTPNGITLPDGRPQFNAVDPLLAGCNATFLGPRLGFSAPNAADLQNGGACDAGGDDQDILLTNSDSNDGRTISFTARLGKTFDYELFNNPASLSLQMGYSYVDATAIFGNLSSTATSLFEETATAVLNNPVAAPSSFSNPHVITLRSSFTQEFIKDYPTRVTAVYVGRDGNPFSYAYDGGTPTTLFGDSDDEERNLLYVPTGPNDPLVDFSNLSAADQTNLFNFLDESGLSEFAGQISPRNAFNDPWFHDVDLRVEQDFPNFVDGLRSTFTFDFENFLNFLGDGSNISRSFDRGDVGEAVPVLDASLSDDGTQFVYNNFSSAEIAQTDGFDRSTAASLWAIQVGVKFEW